MPEPRLAPIRPGNPLAAYQGRQLSFRSWLVIAAIIVLIDQISKQWILASFPIGASLQITPFFNLVHVRNAGAAFSFLADADGWQRPLLIGIAFVAIACVSHLLRQYYAKTLLALALTLVLGGAIGNALDRFLHGNVIDFLDFHWAEWHWPAFNVADIAISIGAVSLIWSEIRQLRRGTTR